MIGAAAIAAILLLAAMSAAWLTQRLAGNVGWIDVFWTFATGTTAVALALIPTMSGQAPSARQILVAVLAGLWAARLGAYLAVRVARSPEDQRYVALRRQWGDRFQRKLLPFVILQAPVGWLLALAVMLAAPGAGVFGQP